MKTFPMFLTTTGRRIVICGGGEQAAQKSRLALKTDARIEVAALELDPELAGLEAEGRIVWRKGPITPDLFRDSVLVFIATGCPGTDAALHALAKQAGALVNVVDQPDLCDAITPSIVDRDPLVIAIGTEGAAPVLARQIKTRLEEMLEPRLGELVALAAHLRDAVAHRLTPQLRRALWRWAFDGAPRRAHAAGREREAAKLIKDAIEAGGPPDKREGFVSLIGAGPGPRDLVTLRAVQRLQEADVIYYDDTVDAEVLELARRDAERVFTGETKGAAAWPAERITARIISAAKRGEQVALLMGGDPAWDTAALDAAGIDCEMVPGVATARGARLSQDEAI